jgi:hypothetical protein
MRLIWLKYFIACFYVYSSLTSYDIVQVFMYKKAYLANFSYGVA